MFSWKTNACVSAILLSGSLNAWADGMKWGYVNAGRVYSESKVAQGIEMRLQKEFAQQRQTVHTLEDENRGIIQRLTQTPNVGDAERMKWEHQLAQNRSAIAKFVEAYNLRRSEEFAALQHNANVIIQRLAEQEQFDLIVQEAVFVKPQHDITDRVIRLLDGGK